MTSIAASESTSVGSPKQRLNVLITDDEPMLRSVIGDFMEVLDLCAFEQANDGIEALEHLRGKPVDCLLSDIRMPRMNLEKLMGEISKEFPDLVVIATSGYSDLESVIHIHEIGADEFLAKPLDLDALERTLIWIPHRSMILKLVERLFGPPSEGSGLDWDGRFAALARALAGVDEAHVARMRHAARTAALAAIVAVDEELCVRRDLRLAALLHEIGATELQLRLIDEARELRANELDLARLTPLLSSRAIRPRLGGSAAPKIVEDHLAWASQDAAEERVWDATRRSRCLLGVVNVLDALVHDRADRAALPLDSARAELKELYSRTNLTPCKQVLSHWDEIEAFYAEAAEPAATASSAAQTPATSDRPV